MSTNISWPVIGGTTYSVPAAGEFSWASLSNYLIALAAAQGTTVQKIGARIAVASPVTVVSATDCLIITKLTVPAVVAVTLPAGVDGQIFIITDGTGDALTNNITITPNGVETIKGASTFVINKNFAGIMIIFKSSNWYIVSEFVNVSGAPFPRSSIAAATANYVVINDGSGLLSEEQYLNRTRGGTGITSTATFPASGVILTRTSTDTGTDRLQSKDLDDDSVKFVDSADTTKAIEFEASGSSTGTTTTVASTSTSSRVLSLPDGTTTLVGRSTSDTGASRLQNKDLDAGSSKFVDPSDTTKTLKTSLSGASTGADLTLVSVCTADRSLTFPDETDTLISRISTDTGADRLKNKELDDQTVFFVDNSDVTKRMSFQLAGITTGETRTLQCPDESTIIVGTNATQVITNKDINGGAAANNNRITVPSGTIASLTALTRKKGTIVYGTDTNTLYADNGAALIALGASSITQEYVYNTDLTNANDTTSFASGIGGGQFGNFSGAIRSKRVQFASAVLQSDIITLEISEDSGVTWTALGQNSIAGTWQLQAGTAYGAFLGPVDATHMDVAFGNHRLASAATFGGAGANWSDVDNDPTFVWRVRKVSL